MSNFSNAYQCYLQGYVGDVEGVMLNACPTERQLQALALGVHHRVTSKPPLMSSVAVTAELRAMMGVKAAKLKGWEPSALLLYSGVVGSTKIPIIKAIRELTNLGLKDAKDIADLVQVGQPQKLEPASFWRPELTPPDRVVAAAKLLRDAGCTVEVS